MSNPDKPCSDRENRVGEAVAWYYRVAEAGSSPNPDDFLARFSDLRPELESFLADKATFDKAVGQPVGVVPDPDATLPPSPNPNTDTIAHIPTGEPTATLPPSISEHATDGLLGSIRYFGDYELLGEIARGGIGVVFRARQVSLNREVALKMILTGQLASAADIARFHAEAEAAAKLDHPNILPIYEIGEHLGQQYFAMKLISGGSLAGKVAELVMDPKTALAVFVKVCRAVDFAHRRGILHRDLKPGNILLDADGTPYVTDFGLAKKVEGDSKLTQSGAIVGTPSYMAPEQARAEKGLTTGVDVYALGAILYELLTGQPPFRGPTVLDTILQVLEKDPVDPRVVNSKADRDLSVIAQKCLEKEPGKRYESAAAVADDLERWLRGEPIVARPAGRGERVVKWVRRNPVVAGTLSASAIAAVGLLIVSGFLWRNAVLRAEAVQSLDQAQQELNQINIHREQAEKNLTEANALAGGARRDLEAARAAATHTLYDADLQLAHVAWQTDNVMAAQELLQQYSKPAEVDPRGFEWHYLWGQTHEERNEWKVDDAITEFNVIFGLAISPDGKTVATAAVGATAADAKIKVWKLADGTLQKTINVGQSMVVNLSFANDGRKLTAVLFKKLDPQGNIMHARAAAARKEPFNISELSGWLETRSWTLADDQPPAITPFDPAHITGTLGLVFTGLFTQHEGIMMSVACIAGSADGKYLALAGSRGETAAAGFGKMIGGRLLVWDVEKARVRAIWETEVPLLSAAFSADGKQVAMGQGDGVVAVRRLDSMGEPKLLRGHAGIVYTLAFNASGSVLVSGALDGQVIVWDVALGKEASRKRGHAKTVMRVEIAPDQRTAVSCGVDGLVKVWDLDRPANPLVLRGHSTMISTLGFTVDSSELISVDDEQAIWWGVVDGRRLKATKSDVGVAMSMSIAPSSGKVAWCSADKVVVRDLESGKNFELTWKDNPLSHHASSQDGKVFAASNFLTEQAGSSTAGLAVWNGGGGPPVATLTALPGSIVALALSPDGSTVAYGHTGGIHLWQWKSGQSRQVLDIDGTLRMLAFSADGQWLAAGSDYSARSGGSKVRVLDLTTNRTRTECLGVGQDLSHLVFSPDGRRLATASHAAAGRGMLKLWDMVSGREVFSAPLPNAMVSAVAFSPDGHRLAAATLALDVFGIMVGRKQFPEIHVWDATPNDARRR